MESKFLYPPCWKDELRMRILFDPFRERNVNPENYDSKLKFWKDIIKDYCLHKGEAIISKQELMESFARENRLPLCMDTVLVEMQKINAICLREDYEYNIESTWNGWIMKQFIRYPLHWSLNKLWSTFGLVNSCERDGFLEYVHLEVINDFCKRLSSILQQAPFIGTVKEYDMFRNDLIDKSLCLSERTLRLCLITLYHNHNIGLLYKKIDEKRCIHLIKIPDANERDSTISEIDQAVANLQATKNHLEKFLQTKETEIQDNKDKLRKCLKNNERLLAKNCLRKIHVLQKSHEKQSMTLCNIEHLMASIQEAKYNGVVLDAYKSGSKALKNVLHKEKLHYDHVDDVIMEVQDALSVNDEIQEALANANLTSTTNTLTKEEDSELEQELKMLLNEYDNAAANEVDETAQEDIQTQNVPSSTINTDLSDILQDLELKTPNKEEIVSNKNSNSALNL